LQGLQFLKPSPALTSFSVSEDEKPVAHLYVKAGVLVPISVSTLMESTRLLPSALAGA
jgi:hypothetical protein